MLPFLGALNWLGFHGYTFHERTFDTSISETTRIVSSRFCYTSLDTPLTNIFIETHAKPTELREEKKKCFAIEFETDLETEYHFGRILLAPDESEAPTQPKRWCTKLTDSDVALRLQMESYTHREKDLEKVIVESKWAKTIIQELFDPRVIPSETLLIKIFSKIC
jgi:hypothetical protein